uniref:Uncharacterized protein n=1 Tax=Romanomermis culicivorax TaxID=13658 RepID=A0A915JLP3_ROMCU
MHSSEEGILMEIAQEPQLFPDRPSLPLGQSRASSPMMPRNYIVQPVAAVLREVCGSCARALCLYKKSLCSTTYRDFQAKALTSYRVNFRVEKLTRIVELAVSRFDLEMEPKLVLYEHTGANLWIDYKNA